MVAAAIGGGGRWDYDDDEEKGVYEASLSQTVSILVAHFALRLGGLLPWQLCNAAWLIARHVDSFPPSARLRPRREETKDDVAICLPGAKSGRSTTSTWDLRGDGIAIAAARRRGPTKRTATTKTSATRCPQTSTPTWT